jgi:acyl phosphate:glycerol-3-phosphate acyltransferase
MPDITHGWPVLALVALLAYLLGSVPFGVVISRAMGLGDLRKIGSGNIGATNVLRTGSKPAAALTVLLDAGKGAAAVLIGRWLLGEDAAQIAGLAAFVGHIFPIYLRFKGGKGMATFLGVMLALAWPVGLAACATWLVVAVIGRISSLAALMSAALTSLWLFLLDRGELIVLVVVLTILIYIRHAANLRRLKAGTEPRIGQRKEG